MQLNEYHEEVMRTADTAYMTRFERLTNGALGLCGEAGEVADLLKKAMFQGHEIDEERIAEELGDCAWYLVYTADAMGLRLEEILEKNKAKLRKRYPDGFDSDRSIHRAEYEGRV